LQHADRQHNVVGMQITIYLTSVGIENHVSRNARDVLVHHDAVLPSLKETQDEARVGWDGSPHRCSTVGLGHRIDMALIESPVADSGSPILRNNQGAFSSRWLCCTCTPDHAACSTADKHVIVP
jgi:hypothetical protein